MTSVRGTYFDELEVGQTFIEAPTVTLTEGLAAAHHAIVGNRLRLALDRPLAAQVTGAPGLASPALVWDVSIGQSTVVTQKVRANLFYRNLRFQRFPHLGDSLTTVTTVDALCTNRVRPNRPRTGMAALHIVTRDQAERTVLDYWRCAMLPISPDHEPSRPLPADDLDAVGAGPATVAPADQPWAGWDVSAYRTATQGQRFSDIHVGQQWEVDGADVITSAPELARLTGNVAAVHHDAARAGGTRLVYGGHTIGLALHHVSRALPDMMAVLSWASCDHLAPVHEGESLVSTITATGTTGMGDAGGVVELRVVTSAVRSGGEVPVLDWRLSVLLP